MREGPWDDPNIQAWCREWQANATRCVKRIHPRCNVDDYGRMYGQTKDGVMITTNYEPDGIPDDINPANRGYFYILNNNPLGNRFYPLTALQYVQQRQAGVDPSALRGCSP